MEANSAVGLGLLTSMHIGFPGNQNECLALAALARIRRFLNEVLHL